MVCFLEHGKALDFRWSLTMAKSKGGKDHQNLTLLRGLRVGGAHLRIDHLERRVLLARVFSQGLPDSVVLRPGLWSHALSGLPTPQNHKPSEQSCDLSGTRLAF